MGEAKVLLIWLPLFLAAANALAYQFFLFWRYFWLDALLHVLGGLWLGFLGLWFLARRLLPAQTAFRPLVALLLALAFSALGGVLWEIFEYGLKIFFPVAGWRFTDQNFLALLRFKDTISDLAFDLLGGLGAALYYLRPSGYNAKAHENRRERDKAP